ncbi:MAG: hypothetical protein PUE01_10280, partial [Clostridiaceae bacterium]|nr:hypothetical protein [Clostridiaceae bacterium]
IYNSADDTITFKNVGNGSEREFRIKATYKNVTYSATITQKFVKDAQDKPVVPPTSGENNAGDKEKPVVKDETKKDVKKVDKNSKSTVKKTTTKTGDAGFIGTLSMAVASLGVAFAVKKKRK